MVTVEASMRSTRTVERVPNWSTGDWTALRREARRRNWTRAAREFTATEAWDMVKRDLEDMVKFVPTKPRRNPNQPMWMN